MGMRIKTTLSFIDFKDDELNPLNISQNDRTNTRPEDNVMNSAK